MKFSAKVEKIKKSVIRKIFDQAPTGSINLGLGEIQFPTHPLIIESAKKNIHKNIRYSPNAGFYDLREQIADKYSNINAKNVCVTNGAEEAIFATLYSLVNCGDEILIANPTFLAYATIINSLGGTPIYFDLLTDTNFELDKNSLEKKISKQTKAILLCNPSNPLSKSFSPSEMDYIIEICKKNDLTLIIDEIYRELFLEKINESIIGKYENTIIISGISKSYAMTGWRIGWVLSDKKTIEKITISHQYISTCASSLSQYVANDVLSEKGDIIVQENREKLKVNFYIVKDFLDSKKQNYCKPDSAPYFFIDIQKDDIQFVQQALQEKVIVIPGSAFGSNGKKFIRLSYGLEQERLLQALEKIDKCF